MQYKEDMLKRGRRKGRGISNQLSLEVPAIWIRAPKLGPEKFCGLSRAKLYVLADEREIRSTSLRKPGQKKGTRLFHLQSILDYFARIEGSQMNTSNTGTGNRLERKKGVLKAKATI